MFIAGDLHFYSSRNHYKIGRQAYVLIFCPFHSKLLNRHRLREHLRRRSEVMRTRILRQWDLSSGNLQVWSVPSKSVLFVLITKELMFYL